MRLSRILMVLLPGAVLLTAGAGLAQVVTGTFTATDDKNGDNTASASFNDGLIDDNEATVICTCDDGVDVIEWVFDTDLIDGVSLKETSAKIGQEQKVNPAEMTAELNGGGAVDATCDEVKVSASVKDKKGVAELSWSASSKNCDAGAVIAGLVDLVCKNNVVKNGGKAKANGNQLKSVSCKGKGAAD